MKCPNCGEIIKEKKLNFCGFCGSNLKTGEKTLTAPFTKENNSSSRDVTEKIQNFPAAPVNAPLPVNNNYASPFEQMVKETAAAQGIGGFQNNIPAFTPPPSVPETNTFTPAPETVKAPETESAKTIVAPQPFTPQIVAPPSVSAVQEKPASPAAAPSPAASSSPIAAFNPASLSAFDPYKHTEPVKEMVQPSFTAPQVNSPADSSTSFTDMHSELKALAETEPVSPVYEVQNPDPDPAPVQEEVKPKEEQPKRNSFDPSINLSKNVKIRNASDDPDNNSITYMEYTRNFGNTEETAADSKYSSYSFAPPQTTAAEPVNEPVNEPVKTQEEIRKEEAKKVLDESVDSILNFASQKTASDIQSAVTAATESASAPAVSAFTESEPVKSAVPEPAPAPEPVKEPEPEIIKEKVINYVGQEKKAAEQMINFKGLKAEIEYVENEKEYNFVIAQSIPADTEVLPGTTILLTVSAGTWSEWEENPMPVSPAKYEIETKTEFRKRTRTRTTDKRDTTDTTAFQDYRLVGTDSRYTDWEIDQYYTSEAIPPGETCEIVRVASGFKYAGWFNPANMTGMSFSSPDVANFFNTNLSNVKWTYEEIISEQNIKPDVKNWKLITDDMTSTPAGDPMVSNIFFSAHVVDGKSYAMKFGSTDTEWYIYKKRSLIETIYHLEKEIISDWNDWTEWSETEQTASEDCQVESRTLTRSKRKIQNT